MHRSEGLLGCCHRLEHGARSCHPVHATLYCVETRTFDSAESDVVWNLRVGCTVSLYPIRCLPKLRWLTKHDSVCVASLMRIITIDLVKGGDLTCKLSQVLSLYKSNVCTDTIITCYMWSQVEPTMAIVCACLTTLRPLFTGIDLTFLSSLSWTTRRTASTSFAKSKRRWLDPKDDPRSKRREEEKRIRSLSEPRDDDIELLGFEQAVNAGTQGGITFMEKATSLKNEDSWLDDSISTTIRVRSEDAFV